MAGNSSSGLEAWAYRPAFSDNSWIYDASARDTETLTRALQISLSQQSDTLLPSSCSPSYFVKPEPAGSASGSDPEMLPRRARNPVLSSPSGKISKRKSRASKRSPTTFINADPSNFRQMVQQVTGVRFGYSGLPSEPVLKPEPQRAGSRVILPQSCLPTLDSSEFFLDRAGQGLNPGLDEDSFDFESLVGPGTGLDSNFDPFPCFPTLESWGVI